MRARCEDLIKEEEQARLSKAAVEEVDLQQNVDFRLK